MSIVKYINKIFDIQAKNKSLSSARKFSLHPISDVESYKFFCEQENIHWSHLELNFIEDKNCYNSLPENIKNLVDYVLAFFLPGDGLISNIVMIFMLECSSFEEQAMFISQQHIELIHAETYALIAETFIPSDEKILDLVENAEAKPCVHRKLKFMEKWMLSDKPRWCRLLAAACAEGIFFCVLFAVIFWLRSKNLLKNFVAANELISRDESLHRDFDLMLYLREVEKILEPLKGTDEYFNVKNEIRNESLKIIKEALEVEDEFSDEILSQEVEDLNREDLKIYSRIVVDNFLTTINMDPIFNMKNPFTWMDDITLQQKGNFYEVRIGAYKKTSSQDAMNINKRAGREEVENPFDGDVNFGELDDEIDFENL